MYEISIKHKDVGKRVYNIYTKDEADTKGVDYKYWKEANKGEYALTDDNYVGEVIQKKCYTGDNGVDSYYVRMPLAMPFILLGILINGLKQMVEYLITQCLASLSSKYVKVHKSGKTSQWSIASYLIWIWLSILSLVTLLQISGVL